jgi:hypothetical protein
LRFFRRLVLDAWIDARRVRIAMKPTGFKLPKNEVETEAEIHAEETRRAVSAASKGRQAKPKQSNQRKKSARGS